MMRVHLLRCDACGRVLWVNRFEDPRLRQLMYRLWLGTPAVGMTEKDVAELFDPDTPREPLTGAEYRAAVEGSVGACGCGGGFRFRGAVRCPGCGSASVGPGRAVSDYD
jgi:hypothetical protein